MTAGQLLLKEQMSVLLKNKKLQSATLQFLDFFFIRLSTLYPVGRVIRLRYAFQIVFS